MTELLALPEWNTPPRTIADWVAQFAKEGHRPVLDRESDEVTLLEIASLRLRGYAVIEGQQVTAINFELADSDHEPAAHLVSNAAAALGWEIHPDDGSDDEDDTD